MTRALSFVGCALPRDIMAANPTNPTGHWEPRVLVAFNDEVLSSAGSDWSDWQPMGESWARSPLYPAQVQRGAELLREEFGLSPLFALKDPRNCRLAGLWYDILAAEGVSAATVLCVRNPAEVTASLADRDGFDSTSGNLLWLCHVLEAEAASRGRLRTVVSYEQLCQSPEALIARIGRDLGLCWPRYGNAAFSDIAEFLRPELRHHKHADAAVMDNPCLSEWVRQAYAVFTRWAEHGEEAADYAVLNRILEQFSAAMPAFGGLAVALRQAREKLAAQENGRDAEAEVARLEAAINWGDAQRGALEAELEKVRAALAEGETRERDAFARVAQLSAQHAAMEESQARLAQANLEWEACSARSEGELEALRAANRAAQEQWAEQNSALSRALQLAERDMDLARRDADMLRAELGPLVSRIAQRDEELEQTSRDLDLARKAAEAEAAGRVAADEAREAAELRAREQGEWVFRLAGERAGLEQALALVERRLAFSEKAQAEEVRKAEHHALAAEDGRIRLAALDEVCANLQALVDAASVERDRARQEVKQVLAGSQAQIEEIATLSRHLQQAERQAADAQGARRALQTAQDERFDEIQRLSQMLIHAEAAGERARWLAQVNGALRRRPLWWRFMSSRWVRRRELQRLERLGLFDHAAYLARYPDVAAEKCDPLWHYILHGMGEGRQI